MPTECGLEDGQLFKILLVLEDADDAPAYLGVGINQEHFSSLPSTSRDVKTPNGGVGSPCDRFPSNFQPFGPIVLLMNTILHRGQIRGLFFDEYMPRDIFGKIAFGN